MSVTAGSDAAHSITGSRTAQVTAGASATCSPSGAINQNEEREGREHGQTNHEGCHRQKIEIEVHCRLEHGQNKQENEHELTNQGVPVAPFHPDSVGTKMILLCGLLPLIPRGGGSIGRFGIWPGYLVQSLYGPRSGDLPKGLMISVHGLFSVGLLVKISHFLATLRWPEGAHDLGVGGVSCLELLILCERVAVERLVLLPCSRRAGRPVSVSAVPVGPGIDIWRSCRFIGSNFRFLDRLPGGLRRFIL